MLMSIPAIPIVILTGGKSKRMGGKDKAQVQINGHRMIDIVIERVWPQCHQIFICGPTNYGHGFALIADHPDFEGPCAGILGAAQTLERLEPNRWYGFITVPVDGPNLPRDLARSLQGDQHACVVARDDAGLHPTFAYWAFAGVEKARPDLPKNASLRHLAEATQARAEYWPGTHVFRNINTPEDVEEFG
ncbi:MAG: molybdenum cofactor guanylyltransferase [Devosiaceae bacterium]